MPEFKGLQVSGVQPSNNPDYEFAVFTPGERIIEPGVDVFMPLGTETRTRLFRKGEASKIEGNFYRGGQIAEVKTTVYDVNGKSVSKLTFVLLAGEDKYEIANRELRSKDAVALKSDGQPSAELPSVVAAKKAQEAADALKASTPQAGAAENVGG